MWIAIIERPDGTTYEQIFDGYVADLKDTLGDDYWIVDVRFEEV